jgi:alkanesulfonate monooxygenase SsuD/methylene tetrahydromethanopterin reductase-like flavin-dependent oxidoreductase (luciferase family)
MKEEIELFGVPYKQRGAWSDEAIRVMKSCWRDERVSHRGEFVRFEGLGVAPKPAQGTIPIWIGGHSPRALRRVAELGDGWHAAFPTAAQMKAGIAELAKACRQVGRDLSSLTVSARIGLPAREDADALVREIAELAELGVSHLILESRVRDLEDMTAIYEKFARDIRPRL